MGIYEEISGNRTKTILLISVFLGFVVVLGLIIGLVYGNQYFGLILALIVGTIYFLISYYAGSSMILSMSGAKEAAKPAYTALINTVEGLAIAAGLPKPPKVYVIDDSALNAFATGRNPEHASITVTTGMLQKLNKLELEGVLAHEMSHIKNYDIRVMMLASVLVGLTVLLSDFLLRSFLWGGKGDRKDSNQVTLILIIVGIALAVLSPLIGQLIQLSISRKREYLADASGALLTRYPKGLADALRKIKGDPDPLVDKANKATAHLFISMPFRHDHKESFMQRMFATHPPIEERIKRLEGM
ncbi:MAG: heat shock protein HtpX [archaeon GW2011_AR9]|nr:MAG: heat shock protein HtpX [archaeon GW2011_AR9]MBS3120229.1 M48 family metalloprotease [Candidatus Woesearchaeota archaeon]HIH12659.1 M48 family metalloprotease [Candidatus Woesearchaeota archaeon]